MKTHDGVRCRRYCHDEAEVVTEVIESALAVYTNENVLGFHNVKKEIHKKNVS